MSSIERPDDGEPIKPVPEETFGARLRRLREAAGLSQVALAGQELHPSFISLLEANRRTPTEAAVTAIAARLGVSPHELLSGGRGGASLPERLVLGEAALGLGRPAETMELLADYVPGLTKNRLLADPMAFRTGEACANALERLGRLEEAVMLAERLRAAAEAAPSRLPWLDVTTMLVRCYRDSGDISRAIELGQAALSRANELNLGDLPGGAALVSTVASAYMERGDLLSATVTLDQLIARVDASGSADDRAYARWNAAIASASRGQVGEGLRLAEQASALLALGNDQRSQARLSVTRAWILLASEPPEPAAARKLLRDVLPHLRQHASSQSLASAETELSRCELLLGRPDVACRLAKSAVKRLSPDQTVARGRALAALGAAFVGTGETSLGVAALEEAAEALSEEGIHREAAGVWRRISQTFAALGDLPRSLAAANHALTAVGLPAEHVMPESTATRSKAAARIGSRARV